MNRAPVSRAAWRVAVVEDHRLQRDRTAEVLAHRAGLSVVALTATLPEFVKWLRAAPERTHPHLVVLDLAVDRGESADPLVVKRLVDSGIKVLVMSAMASPQTVRAMIRAGVSGFVSKQDSVADIVSAAHAILRGGRWDTPDLAAVIASDPDRPALSAQEERVLILYASGLTLNAAATHMGIGRETAKQYLERVKAKYADIGRPAKTKLDLYRAASEDGFLDEDLSDHSER